MSKEEISNKEVTLKRMGHPFYGFLYGFCA